MNLANCLYCVGVALKWIGIFLISLVAIAMLLMIGVIFVMFFPLSFVVTIILFGFVTVLELSAIGFARLVEWVDDNKSV